MSKPKITYSVITVPRKEPYLLNLVENLKTTGFFADSKNLPLRLVAGSPDCSYLLSYSDPEMFLVDPMGYEEAKKTSWGIAGLALRATMGHRRCLDQNRVNPGSSYILVMEDDIKFADGWIVRFSEILEEAISVYSNRFILSLYTPGSPTPLDAYRSGKKWILRSHSEFYGVQAVLFPLAVRDEFMKESTERPTFLPHDLSLGKVLGKLGIPILSTAPCLVQHVGRVSSAECAWHDSKSFLEHL